MPLLPRKLRLSLKPSKQLLWLWLWREMRASRGREVGIDAGCGLMQNRMLFETRDYVGIDVDPARQAANQAEYPGVRAVCAEIEQAQEQAGLTGDVVLCVQVMHNRYFATERTVPTVRAMCDMLRPGGILIFNLGERNMPFEDEIDTLLAARFTKVKKRAYGALSARETYLSPILAAAMYLLPPLRLIGGARKVLYVCHGSKQPA
ncbi:MAG: class I SAM-dependent methyltransferase [Rhodospirillaceae bacterium]|jgi:SAM-dependent methyltransferase|nr:class I SAM-dependent methyltransferase [Rhodospirillaceae bacterium]MBT3494340.1 class I SAM-dependent methyltransferase [Rhodospirillaceae bacterium]MBT3780396.1 class I SAM-dependent methyltransferase [Rhodospirillaceae bacterium]MBT3979119.1 class I SAM-dependent methyltransferase [Rhodospirillaceae bacterium]MBT4167776.1 class I SAM-dependent methyltransferase [Rhodospirillaceae bacterium]